MKMTSPTPPDPSKKNNDETKTHTQEKWIGIGLVFGIIFGAVMDNVGVGVAIGLAVGVAIGSSKSKTE